MFTEAQLLLLVAWPLYMYHYCSDFKFLKNGKMDALFREKKKRGGRGLKSVNVSVNGWKTSKIPVIWNFQKGPASKNDAKINPRAKN